MAKPDERSTSVPIAVWLRLPISRPAICSGEKRRGHVP
jgi:hypothetical protein